MHKIFRVFISSLFLFPASISVFAQQNTFTKVFYYPQGSVQVYSIVKTIDHNYIVAGSMNQGALVMKMDSSGTILWSKTIGNLFSSFYSITNTSDSCFVLAGFIQNPVSIEGNFLCVKLNSMGDTLWTRTIAMDESDLCYSVKQTLDNGFILAGSSSQASVVLAKLDPNGNFIWGRKYIGGNLSNEAYEIKQTSDSGFIVTGYIENYPVYDMGMFLMKLTSSGDVSWAKHQVPAANNFTIGYSVGIIPGGYVVYISTSDSGVAVVKTDTLGNVIWSKFYLVQTEDIIGRNMRLTQTSDNGFIAVYGNLFDYGGLFKLDSDGNLLWHQVLILIANDVLESEAGGYMVIGNGPIGGVKTIQNSNPTGAIITTDSMGNGTNCTYPQGISSGGLAINFPEVTFTSVTAGSVSNINLPVTNITLSSYLGCVDKLSTINEKKPESPSIEVFPNPTDGVFSVTENGSGKHEIQRIEVFNALGEKIYGSSDKTDFLLPIDIGRVTDGVYSVKVTFRRASCSKKIVICH
jgi:hypothetical protein